MRPHLRSSMSLLATLLILGCFIRISTPRPEEAATESTHQISLFFSFRDPISLFFPSATISLTDDNSTFFNAKPAAFGPPLPSDGLSGQIWIGNGFSSASFGQPDLYDRNEGELGCDDDEPLLPDDQWIPNGPLPPNYRRSTKSSKEAHIPGKVVLLSRGGCGFSEKVKWAQVRGAAAVIVGDNVPGGPLVRMYAQGDISNITIPSIFTSHTTAHLLSSLIPPGSSRWHSGRLVDGSDAHLSLTDDDDTAPDSVDLLDDNREYGSTDAVSSTTTTKHGAHRTEPDHPSESDPSHVEPPHKGLWVTLTQAEINTSPFFNTLFVLVVSPLLTLAVVYSMLLLRSRIRRRRWRAPKSVVQRLPVHVYHNLSSDSSPVSETADQERCTSTTPLLNPSRSPAIAAARHSRALQDAAFSPSTSSQYGSLDASSPEHEKIDAGLAEWRRKYRGKQKECVICLEEYIDGVSRVMSLPCGHEFHADCITPWLTTRRRTCPICKGDVVRSLGRTQERTRRDMADETEEEVQIQAAETINRSPSAAMPIPHQVLEHDADIERGDRSLSIFSGLGSPPSWMTRNNARANRGLEHGGIQNHDRGPRDELNEELGR